MKTQKDCYMKIIINILIISVKKIFMLPVKNSLGQWSVDYTHWAKSASLPTVVLPLS